MGQQGACEEAGDALLQVVQPDVKEECDALCTQVYNGNEPVCGADKVTYQNPCFAQCAKIDVVKQGACEEDGDALLQVVQPDGKEECDALCTEVYNGNEPVCGADKVTYQNPCFASRAKTDVVQQGACEEGGDALLQVVQPDGKEECDALCTEVYNGKEPVCG